MVVCPRCGYAVDHLHSVPAEVITKELVVAVGDEDGPADLEACNDCIGQLMDE